MRDNGPVPAAVSDADCLAALRAGRVVALPTDTSFALSCDPFCAQAVAELRRLKKLRADRPLPLLIPQPYDVTRIGCHFTALGASLARQFWPGKLTLVIPCQSDLRFAVGRSTDGAVGLRAPAHTWLQALLAQWDGPLVGTSANVTGQTPALTREDVTRYFGSAVAWSAQTPAPGGAPSTVVTVTEDRVAVERWGALSATVLTPYLTVRDHS